MYPDYPQEIQLPSGASVRVLDGVVSIDANLDIETHDEGQSVRLVGGEHLTAAQKVELADVMLDRWKRFRDQHAAAPPNQQL
jgi:hypothetical protein